MLCYRAEEMRGYSADILGAACVRDLANLDPTDASKVTETNSATDWLDGANAIRSIAQSLFRRSHVADRLFTELL